MHGFPTSKRIFAYTSSFLLQTYHCSRRFSRLSSAQESSRVRRSNHSALSAQAQTQAQQLRVASRCSRNFVMKFAVLGFNNSVSIKS